MKAKILECRCNSVALAGNKNHRKAIAQRCYELWNAERGDGRTREEMPGRRAGGKERRGDLEW